MHIHGVMSSHRNNFLFTKKIFQPSLLWFLNIMSAVFVYQKSVTPFTSISLSFLHQTTVECSRVLSLNSLYRLNFYFFFLTS
jgi:hypothetical protein